MLGYLAPVVSRTPHERRPAKTKADPERQPPKSAGHQKLCEAWRGHSYVRWSHSRASRIAFSAGFILLVWCVTHGGFTCGTAGETPTTVGSLNDSFNAQDSSGQDFTRRYDHREDSGAAGKMANPAHKVIPQQSAPTLWQQQPQHQPQTNEPTRDNPVQSLPPWMNLFSLFGHQEESEGTPNLPEPSPLTSPPSPPSKLGGTLPVEGVHTPGVAGASFVSTAKREMPLKSGILFLPSLDLLKNGGFPEERPLTPEEEEEEAIADAIIHGVGKKRVPRIRTGVDALVEAIEDEKLQKRAKSPRQLEVLRERRQADAKTRGPIVEIPEYFQRMAKEAAAYHRQRHAEQKARKKVQSSSALAQHLHTLSQRRRQKEKLLLWRENQIYQSPEESPEVDKRIAEALRTHRELEHILHKELPEEDLLWATGDEEAAKEDGPGRMKDEKKREEK